MSVARRAAVRLVAGLTLIALFWWLEWSPGGGPRVRGLYFFGLWLGYILTVDGLCALRTGSSPMARSHAGWLVMFLVSAPVWWLFEYLNDFLHNWEYLGTEAYSSLEHAAYATLSFSTVVPAVITTAELLAGLGLGRLGQGRPWPRLAMSPRALSGWIALGLVLLGALVVAPRWFFPAAWLAIFFVLDPVNALAGRPAVAGRVARGDWGIVVVLGAATQLCGFFWEMWNVRAWPKWVYHVPYVGFGKVFEMPVLGYLGYIPFGLEVYALYHFLVGLAAPGRWPLHLDDLT